MLARIQVGGKVMETHIGKYKISTDKYNFMIEEEVTPKRKRSEDGGQPYWITLSYHPTLEMACRKLLQCKIKDTVSLLSS